MESVFELALVAMFALCALGMFRMMFQGQRRSGEPGGHRMMCMGHSARDEESEANARTLMELREERLRLDAIIEAIESRSGLRS